MLTHQQNGYIAKMIVLVHTLEMKTEWYLKYIKLYKGSIWDHCFLINDWKKLLNLGWQYRMFGRGSYPYQIYSIEKYEAMTVMMMCHNKAVASSNSWNTKGWEVNFWWDQKSGAKKKNS